MGCSESSIWENYIERQIREAQEQGKFDDLSGKGKPFTHLDTDPLDQVFKSQGCVPRWINLDRDVRERLKAPNSPYGGPMSGRCRRGTAAAPIASSRNRNGTWRNVSLPSGSKRSTN